MAYPLIKLYSFYTTTPTPNYIRENFVAEGRGDLIGITTAQWGQYTIPGWFTETVQIGGINILQDTTMSSMYFGIGGWWQEAIMPLKFKPGQTIRQDITQVASAVPAGDPSSAYLIGFHEGVKTSYVPVRRDSFRRIGFLFEYAGVLAATLPEQTGVIPRQKGQCVGFRFNPTADFDWSSDATQFQVVDLYINGERVLQSYPVSMATAGWTCPAWNTWYFPIEPGSTWSYTVRDIRGTASIIDWAYNLEFIFDEFFNEKQAHFVVNK